MKPAIYDAEDKRECYSRSASKELEQASILNIMAGTVLQGQLTGGNNLCAEDYLYWQVSSY